MAQKTYRPGENYHYPLIIKKLIKTPLIYSPDREIVYAHRNRYSYQTLHERINRLAGGLEQLGVGKGDIVAKTGRPLPLVEIEIFDTREKPLPHDGQTSGEVVMRAPWLTAGYLKEPVKTMELWRSGWLHSGDVGTIDEYGCLQITDRIKDVIKSGGEWISSLDLENLLSQHEAVPESAAIGIADEKWGERPLMIVALKPESKGTVTAAELKKFMQKFAEKGKLPKYGVPDLYEFVDQIPKTTDITILGD